MKTIYVNAHAAGSGTGDENAPFASLYDAVSAAKDALSAGVSDVTLSLAGGRYTLDRAIRICGEELPNSPYTITLEGAASGEKTLLTTAYDIPASDFQPIDGKPYSLFVLPETTKKDGLYPAFRDLFLDGKPMQMARSEIFTLRYDTCRYAEKNGVSINDRLLYLQKDALKDVEWDRESGKIIGSLELWLQMDWQIHAVHLERVIESPKVSLGDDLYAVEVNALEWESFRGASKGTGEQAGYFYPLDNRPYWLQNNKAFLKKEGDFVYADGMIYTVLPAEAETVSYPQEENLFYLENAGGLTLHNLSLCCTTANHITKNGYVTGQGGYIKTYIKGARQPASFLKSGAIYGENVHDITVDACELYSLGGDGISLRGAVDRVSVTGSRFIDIGGTAVRIGNCTPEFSDAIHNADIVIRNNFIQNTGMVYNSNTGILVASAKNLDISYNTILDSAYSAISVGWSWGTYSGHVNLENVTIAHNYIESFMTQMRDGGAIYTLGGNAERGTPGYVDTIHDNYVVLAPETGKNTSHWTVFYHDQGSSHWYDYNNVLVIHPKAFVPSHAYISYQSINPGTNDLKTENMYVIGYHPDVLLGLGEYNRETGEYGIKESAREYTKEQWEAYMPAWVFEKYPKFYEEWIVKGNIPKNEFFAFGLAGTFALADSYKNGFSYSVDPDGGYHASAPDYAEKNNSQHYYIYASFDTLDRAGKADAVRAIAERAGCDGCHPRYGKYTAR